MDFERFPPKDKLLASYTDGDGYTVSIVGGVLPNEELDFGYRRRCGRKFITAPDGDIIRGGFWMAFQEDHWNISDEEWDKMTWEAKAILEVKEQATMYDPLAVQFRYWKQAYPEENGLRRGHSL